MTIICYRDGLMAADSAIFGNGMIVMERKKKIYRNRRGELGACSGPCGVAELFVEWFLDSNPSRTFNGVPPDTGFAAITVTSDGKTFRMGPDGVLYPIETPYDACGACEDFALGAMAAGAGADDAVRLCIRHSAWAAGGVQTEWLHDPS